MKHYYIDLRRFTRQKNNRIDALRSKGFICINDIAAEQNINLHKQMWRLFFKNPQLVGLVICFDRWTDKVRDFSIYCVTHGIQVGIIDLTLDITLKFNPIANLVRTDFAKKQLLFDAYDEIWNAPNRKLDRHAKPERREYLLKQMRDDNFAHFRQIAEEQQFMEQLRAIAKVGDTINVDCVKQVLPTFAFPYELDDAIRQLPAREQERISRELPHFEGEYKLEDFARFEDNCINAPQNALRQLARKVKQNIPNNPTYSRKHLVDFGMTWASRYELPYPSNADQAIFTACEVLYYMQAGIEPCRDPHVEDLVSYEGLHIDNQTDLDNEEALCFE